MSEHEARRVAEERLHASEERFHTLIDAITDYAIFMLDVDGHVATWNLGAQRTKGYSADEIIGQHFSVFYSPEDRAAGRPHRILDEVRRTGRYEEEGWRVRKDGSRFWASVVITALRSREGEIMGFAKVTRDLTDRRKAEEIQRTLSTERAARAASDAERRRLLQLLHEVPAIVNFLRGPELVWEFMHPRLRATSAWADAAGKPLTTLASSPEARAFSERARRVFETGTPSIEHETSAWSDVDEHRGARYWNSAYLAVREPSTGEIEGVMTFDIDVTESVRARRELERVSEENAVARQELEKLNRTKDEFLATMSHELRTPLNAIYGWATLLRKDPLDKNKLERGLEVIERNARAQTRIVSDLLDVSRIISGKLELKMTRTDLSPLIHEAADVVRPGADSKGVRLIIDVDPEIGAILADPIRIHQVLWNLLINAVRFTPRGGRIFVTGERRDSAIVIVVQDSGMGISAEHLPHIFERFRQVDSSTTRAHGGLGLGLSIVRYLVESHGGFVVAESEGLGKGTTFTVTLPVRAVERTPRADGEISAARAPESVDSARANPLLSGVRILVVDDEADSLDVLREILGEAGASVTIATSAREALRALENGQFDLVVSDIGMPGMDGYELMHVIRSGPSGAVPAIALTAYARPEDVERARRAGYREHLSKPVEERRLLETVKALTPPGAELTP